MIIAVCGEPGSGKTTCWKFLIERLEEGKIRFTGFYTLEARDSSGNRIGFEIITTSGSRAVLADIYHFSKYRIGKYYVNINNIEKFIVPALNEFKNGAHDVLIIDEIGKMEMLSTRFREALENILSCKGLIVCTVPAIDFHPLVSLVKKNAYKTFTLYRPQKNAEEVATQIFTEITKIYP